MEKIGIIGGSFNPIHYGHLLMAESAYTQMNLNKVIFVPLKYPPHKNRNDILDDHHRINMIQLAIKDNPHFEFSDYEIIKNDISYTFETLTYFNKMNPENSYYFILGSDSYKNIHTWKNPQIIFDLSTLLVVGRENETMNEVSNITKQLSKDYHHDIKSEYIIMPNIGISSTDIRQRIKNRTSIQYLLPNKVIHYINEHNLYL